MRGWFQRWLWVRLVLVGTIAVWGWLSSRRARVGAGAGEPLQPKSKADLYEEARRLDLPGRSKMDRDELAQAIAEHGSGT